MVDRRRFLAVCSSLGLTGTLFPGAMLALADEKTPITKDTIDAAARIADVTIADEYKQTMLNSLNNATEGYETIYKMHIPNSVAPAIIFDPLPGGWKLSTTRDPLSPKISAAPAIALRAPKNIEDVAFWNVRALAELVKTRKVSATNLTDMYLERLKSTTRRCSS